MSTITTKTQAFNPQHARGLLFWLKRSVLGMLIVLIVLSGVGFAYQAIATAADKRNYPPPGQLVDVGGYRLHLYCVGEGSPTVVLDTLGEGTSVNWGWVQPEVAKTTRVCAYDRAGRGWSEPSPGPRDGRHIAAELHTVLTNAGIAPPYVLVGHSFGGRVTRLYADQFADQVAGMVIVDGGQPAISTARFTAEGREEQAADARFMTVAPFLARLGLFRLVGDPAPDLPPQQRAEFAAFFASTALWDSLYAEQLVAMPTTDEQVRHTGSLGDRPLMIVNANMPADETRRVYNELQAELLVLSSNSVRRIVDGASHTSLVYNQQHAQQTSAAIRQVVEAVREGKRLASQ